MKWSDNFMENEKSLLEVKPSSMSLIPHIILMLFTIGLITIWKPLISLSTTYLKVTNKNVEGKKD